MAISSGVVNLVLHGVAPVTSSTQANFVTTTTAPLIALSTFSTTATSSGNDIQSGSTTSNFTTTVVNNLSIQTVNGSTTAGLVTLAYTTDLPYIPWTAINAAASVFTSAQSNNSQLWTKV